VSNICVHAIPDATHPIAIIFPHEVNLRASLPDEDPRTSLGDLCANTKVKALLLKECNAAGKKSGFKGHEMLQAVVLTADEWTPESGLVTAAQKLQRKKIAQKYDAGISVRFFSFTLLSSCVVSCRHRTHAPTHQRGLVIYNLTDNQFFCRRLSGFGNESRYWQ